MEQQVDLSIPKLPRHDDHKHNFSKKQIDFLKKTPAAHGLYRLFNMLNWRMNYLKPTMNAIVKHVSIWQMLEAISEESPMATIVGFRYFGEDRYGFRVRTVGNKTTSITVRGNAVTYIDGFGATPVWEKDVAGSLTTVDMTTGHLLTTKYNSKDDVGIEHGHFIVPGFPELDIFETAQATNDGQTNVVTGFFLRHHRDDIAVLDGFRGGQGTYSIHIERFLAPNKKQRLVRVRHMLPSGTQTDYFQKGHCIMTVTPDTIIRQRFHNDRLIRRTIEQLIPGQPLNIYEYKYEYSGGTLKSVEATTNDTAIEAGIKITF